VVGSGCVLVLFCGFGGFLMIARMFREDSAMLPSDMELAHQRGLPVTFADLRKLTAAVPDSLNAAPIYLKAMRELQKLPENQVRELWIGRNPSIEQRQRRARAIESFQPTLRILERANDLPYCVYRDEFSESENVWTIWHKITSADGPILRDASAYIGAEAQMKVVQKDFAGAFRDLTTLIALARHSGEYNRLSRSSALGFDQTGIFNQLRWIASRNPTDMAVLSQVEHLASQLNPPDIYKAIQTDFVYAFETIGRTKNLEEIGLDKNTPAVFNRAVNTLYQTPGVRDGFKANLLKTYLRAFAALPKRSDDWLAVYAALKQIDKSIADDQTVDNVLTKAVLWLPPIPPLIFAWATMQKRLVLEGVAVLRQYHATGKFPAALPIVGDTSINPFWGDPLEYRVEGKEFSITARGRDFGKDGPQFTKRDIVFRFPPRREPPRSRQSY